MMVCTVCSYVHAYINVCTHINGCYLMCVCGCPANGERCGVCTNVSRPESRGGC